jgi:hypothetical protein
MTEATWVLFLYLTIPGSSTGGMTLTSAEFTSKARCESAAEATKQTFTTFITIQRHICVAK